MKAKVDGVQRFAILSDDKRYRYTLTRRWDGDTGGRKVLWVMLNPSTADAFIDDMTVTKCVGFSKRWGYDALTIVNLFALRATDPSELLTADDPRGPDNAWIVRNAIRSDAHPLIVCAWGGGFNGKLSRFNIEKWAKEAGKKLMCLGRTKSGYPRHPSRAGYERQLEEL